MCREPALRTGVDLAKEPVCWRPARDFSGVFSFTDLREKGCESLEEGHTMHIEIKKHKSPGTLEKIQFII